MYKEIRIWINKIRITLKNFKGRYEIVLFSINFSIHNVSCLDNCLQMFL